MRDPSHGWKTEKYTNFFISLYRHAADAKLIISDEDNTFSGESSTFPVEISSASDLSTPKEDHCIPVLDPCDEEPAILSQEGIFCQVPDGSTYPRNAECAWTISAPTGYVSSTCT